MTSDMANLWVGPMPVDQFLKDFLPVANEPCPVLPSDYFNEMPKVTKEAEMYAPFIKLLQEKNNLIPSYKMVDTSNHPDKASAKGTKIKPDPTIYHESVNTSEEVTQFGEVELHFELKPNHHSDPFRDPKPDTTSEARVKYHFEAQSSEKRKACRVFLGDPWVRFIRWDRAGASFQKSSIPRAVSSLVEFLWRFAHASPADRGHDPTVRRATDEESELAYKHLDDWKPLHKRPVVVMSIMDGEKKREFIAWGAKSHSGSLTGRCTRAYPVFEVASGLKFFLKDTWRAFSLSKEAGILRELQVAEVQYIPPFVCGDDISGQVTVTDLYVPEVILPKKSSDTDGARGGDADGMTSVTPTDSAHQASTTTTTRPPRPDSSWRCGNFWKRITQRFHHRFVVDFIGKPLEKFSSSREMMQAISDAYTAHMQAYEKCGIIHRDISAGNIMLDDNNRGILNDWDLAKHEEDILEGGRPHERTGTWEFMSSQILQDPEKLHTIQDDIESFIHVVLYLGLRYLEHNRLPELRSIFSNVFEDQDLDRKGRKVGGQNKESMFTRRKFIDKKFAFVCSGPLTTWLGDVFHAMQQYLDFLSSPYDNAPTMNTWLPTHEYIASTFTKALKLPGWPKADEAKDGFLLIPKDVMPFADSDTSDQSTEASTSAQTMSTVGSKRGRSSQLDDDEYGTSTGSRKRSRSDAPRPPPRTTRSSTRHTPVNPSRLRDSITGDEL
ncbi:hypothetical protein Hypma_014861 [Hypsizygus marmoreus]|uniref:Fungal-type protein kinase domain-containing protein n=1 Tax=Hypsizygus marmoreus TaxID=39966 RepID=A0A369K7J8_HYPMA|nr:hypothetical protein Hypma_014861 [Hypsizygus marmoreus]